MKRVVYFLALSTSACIMAQESFCSTGPSSVDVHRIAGTPTPTPTPSPSPTPAPLPAATPNPCSFAKMTLDLHDGSQSIAVGAQEKMDLTPYYSSGIKLPDLCNQTREPKWISLTPAFCEVVGGGFNPNLLGKAPTINKCEVFATLLDEFTGITIVSNTFRPEIK